MMAAPMEVVFSFDTTGSMSQVLDEVKARVNDVVQRLQADIPGFKVGIIAHGDYCDAAEFYDIRTQDLTSSLPDVVNFVSETEGTGGGDIPECYELALRHARDMSWTPGSRRVLVVIGDAHPHEPDYPMNTLNIDWQEELSSLVSKSVRIYGVQYGEDADSLAFFKRLTSQSGGQHLRLQDMGDICRVIMAICYREQGPDIYLNYEAEVRAQNENAALGAGLEMALGTLRKAPTLPLPDPEVSEDARSPNPCLACSESRGTSSGATNHMDTNGDMTRRDTDSEDILARDVSGRNTLKRKRDSSIGNSNPRAIKFAKLESTNAKATVTQSPVAGTVNVGCVEPTKISKTPNVSSSNKKTKPQCKQEKDKKTSHRRIPGQKRNPKPKTNIQTVAKIKRESVGGKTFGFSHLPWSQWHLAAAGPGMAGEAGEWTSIAQRNYKAMDMAPGTECERDTYKTPIFRRHILKGENHGSVWRSDLLDLCYARVERELHRDGLMTRNMKKTIRTKGGIVFELGIMAPKTRAINAVWFHATNQRLNRTTGIPAMFRKPWYSGLAREIRVPLSKAVLGGSRVYLRWAIVDQVLAVKRGILAQYEYPWRS